MFRLRAFPTIETERFDKLCKRSADLLHSLSNRSVSIVGNARSLNKNSFGSKIDKNDIVIRLNRSPISSESSHGIKTTWIATATSLGNELLNQRNPEVILWMTPKI